jgi:hypothetical protein
MRLAKKLRLPCRSERLGDWVRSSPRSNRNESSNLIRSASFSPEPFSSRGRLGSKPPFLANSTLKPWAPTTRRQAKLFSRAAFLGSSVPFSKNTVLQSQASWTFPTNQTTAGSNSFRMTPLHWLLELPWIAEQDVTLRGLRDGEDFSE